MRRPRVLLNLLLLVAFFTLELPGGLVLAGETGEAAAVAITKKNTSQEWAENRLPVVLFPRREALLSAEVSASILTIHKQLGESFAKGDPLITFDAFRYQAVVEKTQIALAAARLEYEMIKGLFQRKSKSKMDVVHAEREYRSLQVDLKMARHELAACVVRAPYAGRVARLEVNEHELVRRNDPLLAIVSDHILRARFLAPASAITTIRLGRTTPLKLVDLPGKVFIGTVTQISPMNDAASRTFEVFAEIKNPTGILRSGMVGVLELDQVGK